MILQNEEKSKETNTSASEPLKEEVVDIEKAIPSQKKVKKSTEVVDSEEKLSEPSTKSQVNTIAHKTSTTLEFVDALEKIESEKVVEVTSSSQTQNQEDKKT